MGNGNSSISKSKVHCQPTKPTHEGHGIKGAAFRAEYVNKPKVETQHGLGVHSEQHGMKSLENDDTFTEYIRRTKLNITTVSYIGQEHRNPASVAAPDMANGTNNKENQNDQFSEFIQLTKKKLRTTSRIGENGSFQRG